MTFEEQEIASRQSPNYTAATKVAVGMGVFLMIVTGGAPWISPEPGYAVMGRNVSWDMVTRLVVHFLLCLTYMFAIATAIYSLNVGCSILLALAISGMLYVLNHIFFSAIGYGNEWGNAHALGAHFAMGLFGGLLYKAISIPKIESE